MRCTYCGCHAVGNHIGTEYNEHTNGRQRSLVEEDYFTCPQCGERELVESRTIKQEVSLC